jgi:hypothetical protein
VEEQVRLAVEKYITGVKARDARIVQDAFQENGMMWGYLGNKYTEMTAADFAAHVVATAPEPDPNYSAKVHSVQVTGEIATAILDERHYLGPTSVTISVWYAPMASGGSPAKCSLP